MNTAHNLHSHHIFPCFCMIYRDWQCWYIFRCNFVYICFNFHVSTKYIIIVSWSSIVHLRTFRTKDDISCESEYCSSDYITVLVGTDTHTVCVLWQMTRVTRWSGIMCSYLSQDHARGRGWVRAEYVRMWPLHGDQWSRLYRATQLHLHWYWIWASARYFDF